MWDAFDSLTSKDVVVVIGTSGVVLPITEMALQFRGFKILNNLGPEPAREFHLRELSRRSNMTLGTIEQGVARLAKADLLIARRDGNLLNYRSNTQHPIFPDIQGIALKTTGLREQLAEALG